MKHNTFYLGLGAILLIISSCSSIEVSENFDDTYNFSKLKTYDLVPVENKKHALVVKQLKSEIKKHLATKGFEQTSNNPDFLVAMHGGTEDKVIVHSSNYGYRYGDWYSNSRYRVAARTDVYEYKEGTLVIDVIDAKSKELVFQSTSTKTLDKGASAKQRQENIKNVVTKALQSFPPTVKK